VKSGLRPKVGRGPAALDRFKKDRFPNHILETKASMDHHG
jgi:hypothetical protein